MQITNTFHCPRIEFHENITLLLFCFFVVLHHLIYLPSISKWRNQNLMSRKCKNQREENLNDKIRFKLDKSRLKLRKHRTMKLIKHFLCIFYVMKFLIGRFFRVWLTMVRYASEKNWRFFCDFQRSVVAARYCILVYAIQT